MILSDDAINRFFQNVYGCTWQEIERRQKGQEKAAKKAKRQLGKGLAPAERKTEKNA